MNLVSDALGAQGGGMVLRWLGFAGLLLVLVRVRPWRWLGPWWRGRRG